MQHDANRRFILYSTLLFDSLRTSGKYKTQRLHFFLKIAIARKYQQANKSKLQKNLKGEYGIEVIERTQ